MPPPWNDVELDEMLALETESVPALLKPPPLAEVLLAPDTVTPEMVRFPPEAIEKMLKLPLLPLIVSEGAPRPLILRAPMVPPEIAVLAFKIVGNAEFKLMLYVLAPVKLNWIVSSPAVVFAELIAARREPARASLVLVTKKIVGVILSSN